MATMRGPDRPIHSPPTKAANPRDKIVMLNVVLTAVTDVPYCSASASRNTLQAYTAPSATCITTPATAMITRLPAPELLTAWLAIRLLPYELFPCTNTTVDVCARIG